MDSLDALLLFGLSPAFAFLAAWFAGQVRDLLRAPPVREPETVRVATVIVPDARLVAVAEYRAAHADRATEVQAAQLAAVDTLADAADAILARVHARRSLAIAASLRAVPSVASPEYRAQLIAISLAACPSDPIKSRKPSTRRTSRRSIAMVAA